MRVFCLLREPRGLTELEACDTPRQSGLTALQRGWQGGKWSVQGHKFIRQQARNVMVVYLRYPHLPHALKVGVFLIPIFFNLFSYHFAQFGNLGNLRGKKKKNN